MHSKRVKKVSHDLCARAVEKAFEHKWSRADTLDFVSKYSGVPSHEILACEFTNDRSPKSEAVQSITLFLEDLMESILTDGGYAEDHIVPVDIKPRKDGMTGKTRDIARLCIAHQLIGHVAVLMLEDLFKAYLLPTQHASIPGRGQTRLKNQVHKWLRSEKLRINQMVKIDIRQAYASTQYSVAIDIIRRLDGNEQIVKILEYLANLAPNGHLIIGGYLDAWLFNLVMADILHEVNGCGQTRRGRFKPYAVRVVAYMDDVAIFTASDKATKRVLKYLAKTLPDYDLTMKVTTSVIRFLPLGSERDRRHRKNHGCPCVDMAGFKIHRTYISVRRRVYLRLRRILIRSWNELVQTGTIRIKRSQMLISYHGWLVQSDSYKARTRYHIKEIMAVVKRVVAFHGYLDRLKRKDKLDDFIKNRVGAFSEESQDYIQPRWLKSCPYI